MSQTHWKKLHNPDYLGAYSLEPGKDKILTIKIIKTETVTGPDNRKEECMIATFVEPEKPMIINSTNAKTITKTYGTPYIEEWAGKKIQVYSKTIKAFGDTIEALRIRPTEPKQTELVCGDCNKPITKYKGLTPEQLAQATRGKYGLPLCSDCAKARKEKNEAAEKKSDEQEPGQEEIDRITGNEEQTISTNTEGVIIDANE